MSRHLIVYPNCSKGGVTSVIRNRALLHPENEIIAVFINDRGGRDAYANIPNLQVRVVDERVLDSYLAYVVSTFNPDQTSILNLPLSANNIPKHEGMKLVYEFHSSSLPSIHKELGKLDVENIDEFWVPSEQMRSVLSTELESELMQKFQVVPNEVNLDVFTKEGKRINLALVFEQPCKPLVWIGRLEWLKGDVDFLRLVAALPDEYKAVMIVSLENDILKVERMLHEANALGVSDRLHFVMDLSQEEVAAYMRAAVENSGWFVSTSYNESFGYAVYEALGTGLRTVAFRPQVEVWTDLSEEDGAFFVPLGDIRGMKDIILSQS